MKSEASNPINAEIHSDYIKTNMIPSTISYEDSPDGIKKEKFEMKKIELFYHNMGFPNRNEKEEKEFVNISNDLSFTNSNHVDSSFSELELTFHVKEEETLLNKSYIQLKIDHKYDDPNAHDHIRLDLVLSKLHSLKKFCDKEKQYINVLRLHGMLKKIFEK